MAQQTLDQNKDTMNDTQREIIERAIQNDGKISDADYERAWQSYNQCIVNKGYNPQPLTQIEGIYLDGVYMPANKADDALQQKFESDLWSCTTENNREVQHLYSISKGNPNLIAGDAAAVDCLHRNNLVPKNYTLKEFTQEKEQYDNIHAESEDPASLATAQKAANSLSFDLNDNTTKLCLVANNAQYFFDNIRPQWQPFK
ncbi:hypothetical protein [Bifidobacterium dolichotidis]|nr:hypothetical protein [Bifidobacterium dolichotidis]